jgi:peptide-methionine (S)-S-oxide reductase
MERNRLRLWLTTLVGGLGMASCAVGAPPQDHNMAKLKPVPPGAQSVVIAGGCFWCVEGLFTELRGVYSAQSGYAGGAVEHPTYEQVCSGTTGHAEAVRVIFDPKQIAEKDLLRIFFTTHDPTTLNRQGNDSGTQYRSAIFFANPAEKVLAQQVIDEIAKEKIYPDPIVTSLEPLKAFYPAEEYHQLYYTKFEKGSPAEKALMNAGYCQYVVAPKVEKFRHKFAKLLKTSKG